MPTDRVSHRPAWMADGLCTQVGGDVFFPDEEQPREPARVRVERETLLRQAKAVCRRCDVVTVCRATAMASEPGWGIWGGLSSADRAHIRRRQWETGVSDA